MGMGNPIGLAQVLASVDVPTDPHQQLTDVSTPLGMSIIEQAWNTQPGILPAWLDAIESGSAAQKKSVCPIFVCKDTFDGGTVVQVVLQTDYVKEMQALGGHSTTKEYPHDDHFSLPTSCIADATAWLKPLFTTT